MAIVICMHAGYMQATGYYTLHRMICLHSSCETATYVHVYTGVVITCFAELPIMAVQISMVELHYHTAGLLYMVMDFHAMYS